MKASRQWPVFGVMIFLLTVVMLSSLWALVPPDRSRGVGQKTYRHPDFDIPNAFERPSQLPPQAAAALQQQLAGLGLSDEKGRLDHRGGRWATLLFSEPLIPGKGRGNTLNWQNGPPRNDTAYQQAAENALSNFLQATAARLRINLNELVRPGRVTVHRGGEVIQAYMPRQIDGIPVRGSHLSATINNGNLVLLGAHNWGTINISTQPEMSQDDALASLQAYLDTFTPNGTWGRPELNIVVMARGRNVNRMPVGQGYTHRLVWVLKVTVAGDQGRWEALVDAESGEVLSFEDTNHYAEGKGGVLPVTNDGIVPDGVEQAGWPTPFDNVSTQGGPPQTSDTGGNIAATGNITSNLLGQYIRMNDNCGSISLTQNGGIDFGTSGGTDCTTPGFGGAGNTHASRTGFYELNKIKEMARGQLPGNSWLQQQLTANMNINNTCNAFWNGSTVNFYRSGGGCSNTGEIAGVFDHEWGHGMDANDTNGGIASPSGEGIADIYTALRLNDSCIGRNFRSTVCSGNGDPCLTCTGVRDIDYLKRQSGQPHDYTWSNANCFGSVHCVGGVYAEAVWSLWKRNLQSPPYNYDNNTAHEIVTRLTFIGAGNTSTWFSGGPPYGGCAGSSGYMNYLAADDDNGDLSDGTPHMPAIFGAFNDQEIACDTPTVIQKQDFTGCAGAPTAAPTVTGTAADKSAGLTWGSVAGATEYEVFRTEGVFACDFGKVKLGATTGTVWNDSGLQNGREYSYVVIPKGPADSCFGPASSCTTVTPASGPNLAVDTGSATLSITTGDGDAFLDNCEDGTMTFDVDNIGLGTLTNVSIVNVTPSNGGVTVTNSFPAAISPLPLAEGATGSGSFSFTAGSLSAGETLTFQVEVTADELAGSRFADLTVMSSETDLTFTPSVTYSFENDSDGWTTVQGTFDLISAYEQSSANLDNQCDQIQSPVMVLSTTSTLTLSNNYDIEPFYIPTASWYDRANVGIHEVATGVRTTVTPDGGRLYNASGPEGTCGTAGQPGWADTATTWANSTWSAGALGSAGYADKQIQFDIRYGTDPALNGDGFRFDEVTVTDVSFQIADGQSDTCSSCVIDADCEDGVFCNGIETCSGGTCQAGTPVVCDDGVACTDDSCNALTDLCNYVPNDANCPDNGNFCDGVKTCDAVDGCVPGTAPDCNDNIDCTDDSCNALTGSCSNVPNDANCPDNGIFCDGVKTCDAVLGCQVGSDPCPGEDCDEDNDICVPSVCDNNGVCEAGEDCNNCAADCVLPIPRAVCGNGLCEAGDGEDCVSCPADCAGKTDGRPSGRFCCGFDDGFLPEGCSDDRCDPESGSFRCTNTPTGGGGTSCCGDVVCEGAEDVDNCAVDCDTCGNGFCDPGEDQCSCTADCVVGSLPAKETGFCSDLIDNDCDMAVDCDDDDCRDDPGCICGPKGDDCTQGTDCCSGQCKNNGTCR